eukprot:scaffold20282_cov152-Isochrysis_galbana.AAC.2
MDRVPAASRLKRGPMMRLALAMISILLVSHRPSREGDGDEEVTTKVRRYNKMICTGGRGKGEQLAQHVLERS